MTGQEFLEMGRLLLILGGLAIVAAVFAATDGIGRDKDKRNDD